MKQFGKIIFLLFAFIFVCKLVIPSDLIIEVEDLVELSDDCEPEEDNEEEKDELEWKWNFEGNEQLYEIVSEHLKTQKGALRVGETSDGERVIFSPPPENVI